MITEEQYYRIAHSCDKLLRHPEATFEWIAIPWLHILTEHPIHLVPYQDLIEDAGQKEGIRLFRRLFRRGRASLYSLALLARNFLRPAAYLTLGRARENSTGLGYSAPDILQTVDVIIVSWLVHVDHLQSKEDFYFGNLQSMLADRGLSSLLVLRNQSHYPTVRLLERARMGGTCSRIMLPDANSISEELGLLMRCIRERRRLHRVQQKATSSLERRVICRARRFIVSDGVVSNLRLHSQISTLCHHVRPSIVIVMYEGHAWERCVWHAARTSSPLPILCVGYQHTMLRKHSYAVRRSLGPDKLYDPDVILTLGDVTRRMLEKGQELRDVSLITYGTHRRTNGAVRADGPRSLPTFLVLPEGIESECINLFNFALECARSLPDTHFIFRTHPVLPFQKLKPKLKGYHSPPGNVEISQNRSIDDDFARSGYLMYRGSSTVIYATLAGLKPFYVIKPGEMNIDPLHELSHWRECVSSADDLIGKYRVFQMREHKHSIAEWQLARAFCDNYAQPIREDAIDEVIELAGKTIKNFNFHGSAVGRRIA